MASSRGRYSDSKENDDYKRRSKFMANSILICGKEVIRGKYKGKTVNWVKENAPSYYEWATKKGIM